MSPQLGFDLLSGPSSSGVLTLGRKTRSFPNFAQTQNNNQTQNNQPESTLSENSLCRVHQNRIETICWKPKSVELSLSLEGPIFSR